MPQVWVLLTPHVRDALDRRKYVVLSELPHTATEPTGEGVMASASASIMYGDHGDGSVDCIPLQLGGRTCVWQARVTQTQRLPVAGIA